MEVFVLCTDGTSETYEAFDVGFKDGFLTIVLEENAKFISINKDRIYFFRTTIKDG